MPDKTPRKSGALPFVGNMGDGLEFVRRMWNVSGLPGLPSASGLTQYAQSLPQALPSMITPTLDIDELDKRIADLRAVEQWLNLNTNMLRTTIQSLEVQRNTIATLKSFGGSMLGAVSRGGIDTQHMGLVSVMPQPCSMGTPQRSRTRLISAGDTGEPPSLNWIRAVPRAAVTATPFGTAKISR